MFTVNRNPTDTDLRKFGVAMVIGFGAIGVAFWMLPAIKAWDVAPLAWSGANRQMAAIGLWILGAGLCVLSHASPGLAKPVYVGWMSVAVPIGLVMSKVGLTLLFLLVLPIFSIIVGWGDPLGKKRKKDGTYWTPYREHEPSVERMQRPF